MCLITTQRSPYIAKRDIPVIKILDAINDGELIRFRTPYQMVDIDEDFLEAPCFGITKIYSFKEEYKITEGIHSYINLPTTNRGYTRTVVFTATVVFAATIPKGTPFYIGDRENVVSLRLNLGKILLSNCETGYLKEYFRVCDRAMSDECRKIFDFWHDNLDKIRETW